MFMPFASLLLISRFLCFLTDQTFLRGPRCLLSLFVCLSILSMFSLNYVALHKRLLLCHKVKVGGVELKNFFYLLSVSNPIKS